MARPSRFGRNRAAERCQASFAACADPGTDLVVGLGRLSRLGNACLQHPHMHPDCESQISQAYRPTPEACDLASSHSHGPLFRVMENLLSTFCSPGGRLG